MDGTVSRTYADAATPDGAWERTTPSAGCNSSCGATVFNGAGFNVWASIAYCLIMVGMELRMLCMLSLIILKKLVCESTICLFISCCCNMILFCSLAWSAKVYCSWACISSCDWFILSNRSSKWWILEACTSSSTVDEEAPPHRTSTTLPSSLCHSCLHGRAGGRRINCIDDGLLNEECSRGDDIPPPNKRFHICDRGSEMRSSEWRLVPPGRDVFIVVAETDRGDSVHTLRGLSASTVLLFLLFILLFVLGRNDCLPLPPRSSRGSPWMVALIHLIIVGGKVLWIKRQLHLTHMSEQLLLVIV